MFFILIIICPSVLSACIPLNQNDTNILLSHRFSTSSAKIFLKSYPGYYKIDKFLFKLATCDCLNSRRKIRRKKRGFFITPTRKTPYQINLMHFKIEQAKKIVKKNKKIDKKLKKLIFDRINKDPGLGRFKPILLWNAKRCKVYTHEKKDLHYFPMDLNLNKK